MIRVGHDVMHETDLHSRISAIAGKFVTQVTSISALGNGLINDTYLIEGVSSRFVLQRINGQVFPEPSAIISNMTFLSDYLKKQAHESNQLRFPQLIPPLSGGTYVLEDGAIWRAIDYIGNCESLERVRNRGDAYQAGLALARFHNLFVDLDTKQMADTLPGFHITPNYLCSYHSLLNENPYGLENAEACYCADFIVAHEAIVYDLEVAKNQGFLRLSVTHGDPKLNNFLFDICSKQVVSLIDLDTVKPGLWHYDVGDFLRSCCHRMENDEFDLNIAEACLEGYLSEARRFFTGPDYLFLYPAIRLIPFELGLRFFTDYLDGNRYFKVSEPNQNLQRAVAQFHLCASVCEQQQALLQLIDRLTKPGRLAC